MNRREELEADVVANWDDPDAFLVLADHLMEHGDKHGDLIRAQLACETEPPKQRRHKMAATRLLRELVPELDEDIVKSLHWRRGYIWAIRVDPSRVDLLANLPAKFSRLLRRVDFEAQSDWSRALGALRRYPFLDHVDCTSTNISDTDLPHFAGLGLGSLAMQNTRIGDLAPLVDLPLTKLNVSHSSVVELAPLAYQTRLRTLDLAYGGGIVTLDRLSGLALERLDLRYARVTDLAPLATCASLRMLGLGQCLSLSSLAPLAGLPLTDLRLDSARLQDLDPLAGCTRLRAADLSSSAFARLDALADLPIEELDLERTPVDDVSPLARCRNLRRLDLSYCRNLRDLSPLVGCPQLEVLRARSLHALASLAGAKIVELDIWNSSATDIEVVQTMPNLRLVHTYHPTHKAWLAAQRPDLATASGAGGIARIDVCGSWNPLP